MKLIIVNYHYIDDEQKYKSGIYPVSPERLSDQLDKIGKTFDFIGEKELLDVIEGKNNLSKNSCLITFDDGLRVQYERAVPILAAKKIPAIFFINTRPLSKGIACVVHKIHFLLTILPADAFLEKVLFYYKAIVGRALNEEELFKDRTVNYPDDEAATSQLKYLLNSYLEPDLSEQITDMIFRLYCDDEAEFCEKLYMSKEQLLTLRQNKLFSLGLHTASHIDISAFDKDKVAQDIMENYNYFQKYLSMDAVSGLSFPYGLVNEQVIRGKIEPLADTLGIKYALTTYKGINYDLNKPLFLKRFDANDVIGGKRPIVNF